MTKDEIKKVINEEFKGKAYEGGCVYLTADGRKCAIGLFIPEGHDAQFDQGVVRDMLDNHPSLIEEMPSDDIGLLARFQDCHDTLPNKISVDRQKKILCDFVDREF